MTPPVAILLVLIVITAAIFDVRSRRIPNWLNLTGIVLGFALHAVLSYPFPLDGLKHAGIGMLLRSPCILCST